MSISREIGWGPRENLYYEIYKKLKIMNALAYKWTQGDFHKGSPIVPPIVEIDNILLEIGDDILLEDGFLMLLESA